MFIIHGLKPLVARIAFDIHVIGEVLHPAVFGRTVPMLRAFRDGDDHAGNEFHMLL